MPIIYGFLERITYYNEERLKVIQRMYHYEIFDKVIDSFIGNQSLVF